MSFLNTTAMVTAILEEHEGQYQNFGGADLVRRRTKIEGNIRRAIGKMWFFRPWPWAYTSGAVTILVNQDILMPSNFRTFGRDGGLWTDTGSGTGQRPIGWVPPHRFNDLSFGRPQTGEPRIYTLHTQQTPLAVPGDNRVNVLLYPTNDASRDFTFFYRSTPPIVDDATPGNDELELIPEPWRSDVVWEFATYYQMRDKGNIQGRQEQYQIALDRLKDMAKTERGGIEAPANIAPYGIRRGGGAGRVIYA